MSAILTTCQLGSAGVDAFEILAGQLPSIVAAALVMVDVQRAYLAYHHWQVHYRLETGDVVLPVVWERQEPTGMHVARFARRRTFAP